MCKTSLLLIFSPQQGKDVVLEITVEKACVCPHIWPLWFLLHALYRALSAFPLILHLPPFSLNSSPSISSLPCSLRLPCEGKQMFSCQVCPVSVIIYSIWLAELSVIGSSQMHCSSVPGTWHCQSYCWERPCQQDLFVKFWHFTKTHLSLSVDLSLLSSVIHSYSVVCGCRCR